MQGVVDPGAAAFHKGKVQALRGWIEPNAQSGRRGVAGTFQRSIEKGQGLAVFCGQLQAAQAATVAVSQPSQHGGTGAGTQCLFQCPQRFFWMGGSHPEHPFQVKAVSRQGGGVWDQRRRNPGDPTFVLAEPRQRGEDGLQFTDTLAWVEDFGQCANGPTTAGQAIVEYRKTCGYYGVLGAEGSLPAAPEIGALEEFGQHAK